MTQLNERLRKCYSGAVYDALRSRGITNCVLPKEIVPLDPSLTLAGPAFTVLGEPAPGAGEHETLLRWTEFLSAAPAGHVIVMQGNDESRALMGELSAEALHSRGVAGFVTDGGCRDCRFILKLKFPVFCQYRTPRDVVGAWMPKTFQTTIRIGSVEIVPGDSLIADIDGVVVIPSAIAEDVVAEVEILMQTENLVRKAILAGTDPKEAYLKYGKF